MSLAEAIIERRNDRIAREQRVYRQDHPRASSIGKCARQIYHCIVDWDMRPKPSVELQQRFTRGHDVETIVIRELLGDAWTIVESQIPLEIKEPYKDGEIIICTGHIDGVIEGNLTFDRVSADAIATVDRAVFDIKSINVNTFNRINTARDFSRMGSFWTHYPRQLLLYMWAKSEPLGIFIIDDCLGHWKVLEMHLDDWLDECEDALQTARAAAIGAIEKQAPDYCNDLDTCKDCWCRSVGICAPPMFQPEAMKDLTQDDALNAKLLSVTGVESIGREWKRTTDEIKDTMKAIGPGMYVCGDFSITVKKDGRGTFTTWERMSPAGQCKTGSATDGDSV